MIKLDWTECAAIETVPGKMSGQPVIKGTRVRPVDLLVNREQGVFVAGRELQHPGGDGEGNLCLRRPSPKEGACGYFWMKIYLLRLPSC